MLEFAKLDDFEDFYKMRCEDSNIEWSGHEQCPDYKYLLKWYQCELKRTDRQIYLYHVNNHIVGYLYLDCLNNDEYEVSYSVAESYRRGGVCC